jgi:hypothetical protein
MMEMDEIQQVLATATMILDDVAKNLTRDYGIGDSRVHECASRLRVARRALAEREEAIPYRITEAGRKALEGK